MASTQAIWGIDVGRCALKALKLRMGSEGKVEVVAQDYIEHAKMLSQPDANRQELIGQTLEKFLSRNDLSRDQVVVSVPGQHTLARFTKLPPVAPKRIPDIVRYEADQQIPFDMDEVIWDFQTFEQEDAPDIEVGIFAMKRELIREHLLHFEQAAIEPVVVQPTPLAVYNGIHFDGRLGTDSSTSTIILDIGAESTDLVIATPDSLWTRAVPIGGNYFTDALVKAFKLSFSKAENLKRTAANSKYARQIFQAMRPIFADLVQELQRSIGFYSSTHRDVTIGKVIGVGNALKLPGLQKYLQQNLGLPVELIEKFDKIAPSQAVETGPFSEEVLSFGAAYGLALQGLEVVKVTSSLLPVEIAKQVVWRKKRPAFAAAAACIVLAGGLVWFRQSADMAALAASSDGMDRVMVSAAQASDVIENPLPASLSDRAQAKTLLDAGRLLQKELSSLANKGAPERDTTERLVEFQRNKAIIPRLYEMIHSAVPIPETALGRAETPDEIATAVEAGAAPREDRKQLWIKSLEMDFVNDVNDPIWIPALYDAPPPYNDPDQEGALPGMMVKITVVTPYDKAQKFVDESFLASLRDAGRQAGLGFYIDRVHMIFGKRLEAESSADWRDFLPSTRGGSGGGRAFGGSLRGGGSKTKAVAKATALDPITNEPAVGKDWEFEIWMDVHLGQDFPQDDASAGDMDE